MKIRIEGQSSDPGLPVKWLLKLVIDRSIDLLIYCDCWKFHVLSEKLSQLLFDWPFILQVCK